MVFLMKAFRKYNENIVVNLFARKQNRVLSAEEFRIWKENTVVYLFSRKKKKNKKVISLHMERKNIVHLFYCERTSVIDSLCYSIEIRVKRH